MDHMQENKTIVISECFQSQDASVMARPTPHRFCDDKTETTKNLQFPWYSPQTQNEEIGLIFEYLEEAQLN